MATLPFFIFKGMGRALILLGTGWGHRNVNLGKWHRSIIYLFKMRPGMSRRVVDTMF
jgi:hypothetical protein